MKLARFILLLSLLLATSSVSAQFSVHRLSPATIESLAKMDSIKGRGSLDNPFFSQARWEAERRKIIKDRNTVEFNATLSLSQTQYNNWVAGNQNTFTGRSNIYFRHQYKKDKFNLDYSLNSKYGLSVIDTVMFKSEDALTFNINAGWTMHKNWSYAMSAAVRTQLANGYKSRTDKTTVSKFMAPGTVNIGAGLTYKKNKNILALSFVGGQVSYAFDKNKETGEVRRKANPQLGSSVKVYYEKPFGKKKFLYKFDLYGFSNFKADPTMDAKTSLDVIATKYLTTSISAWVKYDQFAKVATPKKFQYNYALSIELGYKFRNK